MVNILSSEVTSKSRKFTPSIDQLLVTPGANFQLYLALSCIADYGDEIIIPDPGFVSYLSIINFLGMKENIAKESLNVVKI